MSAARLLNLEQEIDYLLVLGQPFLGCLLKSSLKQRHVQARLVGRPPSRAGLGRQHSRAVHLRERDLIERPPSPASCGPAVVAAAVISPLSAVVRPA